jgi:hypothetical protein
MIGLVNVAFWLQKRLFAQKNTNVQLIEEKEI